MNNISRPTCQGWTIILVSALALALGGCGRKGPLDLPPTAASSQAGATASQDDIEAEQAARPGFNPTSGADAGPTAPRGRKKAFVLDPLLD